MPKYKPSPTLEPPPIPDKSQHFFAPSESGKDLTGSPGNPVTSGQNTKTASPPSSGAGVGGSLIAITQELHAIERALFDNEGELSAELEERISASTIAKEQKIDAYTMLLARLDSIELEDATFGQWFLTRSKKAASLGDKLRSNIKFAMRSLGVKFLEGAMSRFTLSTLPKVSIVDAAQIPEEYLREVVKIEPDLHKISAALKMGLSVPGAILTETYSLRTGASKKGMK